jgi:rare lipoprotein A
MQTEPTRAGGAIPRPFSYAQRGRLAAVGVLVLALGTLMSGPAWADSEAVARVGQASWYGSEFGHRRTASGEPFDPAELTGAHRTLPFGSRVRITNLHNGRSVLVTITDRGPFRGHREIDLSYAAARVLGMVGRGVARVLIEPLS